jgi:CheY-like chemotaxis protein
MENRRILLVEDDPDDAELIINGLRRSNVVNEVDIVRDGVEALDYLYRRGPFADRSASQPLLILLDLKMPRVDGRQVLQQIKADPTLKHLPVVVLTSSWSNRCISAT